MMRASLGAVAVALAAASPAMAQTAVVADQGNAFDVGTMTTAEGGVTTIGGGTTAGANLFHSFMQFDLARGDIAQWVRGAPDGPAIANIVNRVTGGSPSNIDGTIFVADMPNAEFWFINPAGVLFGEGAFIDVPGAAHFSTAAALQFADGARFAAVTPDGSTFSSAPVEAFGFLGGQGDIAISEVADLTFFESELSFSAANIVVESLFEVGALSLLAVGEAQGLVGVDGPLPLAGNGRIDIGTADLDAIIIAQSARLAASEINFFGSVLQSQPGGDYAPGIEVFADDLLIENAFVSSSTIGQGAAGSIFVNAARVEMAGGVIEVFSQGADAAGDVTVLADSLALFDRSEIVSVTEAQGDAGSVNVIAGSLTVDASALSSTTSGAGNAGSINILASDVLLANGSFVETDAQAGSTGSAGAIEIEAGSFTAEQTFISSSTAASGNAGSVRIAADQVSLLFNGAVVSEAQAGASGDAGTILIDATSLTMNGGVVNSSVREATTGNAGTISIDAQSLAMDRSAISSSSEGSGRAGAVSIQATDAQIVNRSGIVTSAASADAAGGGAVSIVSKTLAVLDSEVSSVTFGAGDSGSVMLDAEDIHIGDNSLVGALTLFDSTGKAGTVDIDTGFLSIDAASVTTSIRGTGDGGTITISAEEILLTNRGEIAANALSGSSGNAGTVIIDTGALLSDRGAILSSTLGSGDAGRIDLTAGQVLLVNDAFISSRADLGATGNAGQVSINTGFLGMDASTLSTSTFGSGAGGLLSITAQDVLIVNDSAVSSQANGGEGEAGSLSIVTDTLVIDDSEVVSSSFGLGDAGTIDILARDITIEGESFVATQANLVGSQSRAGRVTVDTETLTIDGARLSSNTFSAGNAGVVSVTADTISISNTGFITSSSDESATGNAGGVEIVTGTLTVDGGSAVTSSTVGPGDGGAVNIVADEIVLTDRGFLASLSADQAGGRAGAVTVTTDVLRMDRGRISSSTESALPAGRVDIAAGTILSDNSFILSSTNGGGDAGTVIIRPLAGTEQTSSLVLENVSAISSFTAAGGDAGLVDIAMHSITVGSASSIDSEALTGASGNAGDVLIAADLLNLDRGAISSLSAGSGNAGRVFISAGDIEVRDQSIITTLTEFESPGDAGNITIIAESLTVGDDAIVSSFTGGSGAPGSIQIAADRIDLVEGGSINTDSLFVPAGDITLLLPSTGILTLSGEQPAIITTTSGANSGGRITIAEPYAIVSDGGSILALGEVSGANVRISSDFFIRSADAANLLAVNGSLVLDSQLSDLSTGAETPDIEFLDASSVLRGQCAAARQTGRTSNFTSRVTGPYAPSAEETPATTALSAREPIAVATPGRAPCG